MLIKNTSLFSPVVLTEPGKVPQEIQILRVGKFNHPQYGLFEITTKILAEMKSNFDNRVRGIDVSFDYYHESNEDASGWPKSLELRENGTQLWAVVDWTPKATQKLAERELRYFSPDFAFKWEDPETQTIHSNVLFGGGLTNRPFVKEMQAIVATEFNKEGASQMTELEKAQEALKLAEGKVVKLSEEKADMEKKMSDMVPKAEGGDKVAALEAQIASLQAELAKAKGESEQALAEKKKAEDAKVLAEKTSEFNLLLSEGKACAAQKDAFLKGDMTEFIKLAQPTNMKASGSSSSATDDGHTDDTKAIIKLAEEKQKTDPKLSRGDAISIAKKELKK